MENSVLALGPQILLAWLEFKYVDAFRSETVRAGYRNEFFLGLGKSYVQNPFAIADAFGGELQSHRSLTATRLSFEQVNVASREAATEDVIQAGAAGLGANKIDFRHSL
jgi:hypothetical protein